MPYDRNQLLVLINSKVISWEFVGNRLATPCSSLGGVLFLAKAAFSGMEDRVEPKLSIASKSIVSYGKGTHADVMCVPIAQNG